MKKCCIIAGGDMNDYSVFRSQGVYTICADAGIVHARNLGITPDVLIGDFDTYTGGLPSACEVIRYPVKKDDTDSMLAIKLGLERGFTDFDIYGALGGRIDHTYANIQSLMYILSRGGSGRIIGDREEITLLLPGKYRFPVKDGYYFSLFSYSHECKGLSIRGAEYDVENVVLTNTFPLGISNEIKSDFCEISFESGIILAVYAK